MRIPLNRESAIPLYKQIQDYLQQQILAGSLAPETRLPSSRELARDLGISRITITTVYTELEAQGLIASRQGDGTFVSQPLVLSAEPPTDAGSDKRTLWQQELLGAAPRSAVQIFDDFKAAVARPGLISFAEGNSDGSLFPVDDFRKSLQTVLKEAGKEALGYGDSRGYAPLRATIAQYLTSQGVAAHPSQVLITCGAQQSISLAVRLLLKPGDTILAETPTHMTFLDLCQISGLRLLLAPIDENGMQVDVAEDLIRTQRPRLIYTIPNFQNPSGACLTTARRRQLIALAGRYRIPILEDDFVGELRYRGASLPALKALDHQGLVIHVGTFSKMLVPSLRVGFLLADGPIYDRLLDLKHTDDIAASNLIQRALDAYITVGRYQDCLRRARIKFGRQRDAMLAALERHMPAGVVWTRPAGGLFIWLTLPQGCSSETLLPLALKAGVLFAPGSLFYPAGQTSNSLRLNFCEQPLERIEAGVIRLGTAIREYLTQTSQHNI